MDAAKDLTGFVIESCPLGVLVYDCSREVVFRNAAAARFLERHALPAEVPAVAGNILEALAEGTIEQKFPGQVLFTRGLGQPSRRWTFRFAYRERPDPLVCVFLAEVTASSRVDLNAVRREFRLTRRETDLARLVLDGRTNAEISGEFGIVEQTVKDHLSNVYRKIGVKNRVGLLGLLLGPGDR
jgi:DNA-binding CsgD family transcriptional regulator